MIINRMFKYRQRLYEFLHRHYKSLSYPNEYES